MRSTFADVASWEPCMALPLSPCIGKEWRLRKIKLLGQGHTARKQLSGDSPLGRFPNATLSSPAPPWLPGLISSCPVIHDEPEAWRCEGVCSRSRRLGDKGGPQTIPIPSLELCVPALNPISLFAHPGTPSPESGPFSGSERVPPSSPSPLLPAPPSPHLSPFPTIIASI